MSNGPAAFKDPLCRRTGVPADGDSLSTVGGARYGTLAFARFVVCDFSLWIVYRAQSGTTQAGRLRSISTSSSRL
jgi:hypothetical protein